MANNAQDLIAFDDLDFSDLTSDLFVVLGNDASVATLDAMEQDLIQDEFDALLPKTTFENVLTGAGNDTVKGSKNANIIGLGYGDDYAFGGDGNDIIDGDVTTSDLVGGNDRLDGGNGNDRLRGHAGDDFLIGGNGNDSIDGGLGNDILIAGAGDDKLYGGHGDDYLSGGAGNDDLNGNRGSDVLRSGIGFDQYNFTSVESSTEAFGIDLVIDFAKGCDRINLGTAVAADFSELTITNIWSDGSKVKVTAANGFELNVENVATDIALNLTAADFLFNNVAGETLVGLDAIEMI